VARGRPRFVRTRSERGALAENGPILAPLAAAWQNRERVMNASRSSLEGFHRFLEDLRSWGDRRVGKDRRRREEPVPVERRAGRERRNIGDRRRRAASYLPDAVDLIREMLMDPRLTVRCPDCDGALMLGPGRKHGRSTVRFVHCTDCRRTARLTGLPL